MRKTIILLLALLVQMTAQAQLGSGHFFKTLQKDNLTEQEVVEYFSQWFALPQETEWQRVGERTDRLGMTRVEFRQYVSGVEVEHSQVLLHIRDGRVQTANGTVMEVRQAPAKIRRYAKIYRDGTPTDLLGQTLYLVSTKYGYRYSIKVLSADKSEWIYTDADTGEVLKRIPTRQNLTAEPVKVTGSSLYSGEVQMDASHDTESGTYMLWDQQRNIHTMIGATLPTMDALFENGTFSENFPTLELPADESELTWADVNSLFNNGILSPKDFDLTTYFNKNAIYAASTTPTFDSYRFKTVTFDRLTLTDTESGVKTNFTPTEENPQVLYLNIRYAGTDGMIEQVLDTITSMPATFDLARIKDEIPLACADLLLNSVQYIYDEDGIPTGAVQTPLATLQLVPDASCSMTWSNDDVVASCVYEKNQPWSAVDIHWGMGKTYDFYREVFDRDSYDGLGSPIYNLFYLPSIPNSKSYLVGIDLNNAAASYTLAKPNMRYGMGSQAVGMSSMNPVVELSVMAHEFTHIITGYTADLVYQGESGALNESFSDLMGISVKKYVQGNDASWTIADGVMAYYSNMRSMSFPKESMDGNDPSPDTYQGEYWIDTESDEADHGGVHRNSGVQNKWYYLLTDGDTGTNDNGYSYNITGIGIEKSQQIAYRTLTEYATQESQYADIRLASLQAAADLFGENAPEVMTVDEAWKAVGVGGGGDPTAIRDIEQATDDQLAKELPIYDLAGRKIQNPQKGIYIINGKKTFIK